MVRFLTSERRYIQEPLVMAWPEIRNQNKPIKALCGKSFRNYFETIRLPHPLVTDGQTDKQ